VPPTEPTAAPVTWKATGLEKPIFLDERGHRGRIVRVAGALATLLVAAWLALVVAGPFGFATLPSLQIHPQLHLQVHLRVLRPLVHRGHLPVAAHHRLRGRIDRA
jgi:hypothetical protein